jgi:hypothetical protein
VFEKRQPTALSRLSRALGCPDSAEMGPGNRGAAPSSEIAIDDYGQLYVSDGTRIRKITTGGIITTVAGNGTEGFTGDGGVATALPAPHQSFDSRFRVIFFCSWRKVRGCCASGFEERRATGCAWLGAGLLVMLASRPVLGSLLFGIQGVRCRDNSACNRCGSHSGMPCFASRAVRPCEWNRSGDSGKLICGINFPLRLPDFRTNAHLNI